MQPLAEHILLGRKCRNPVEVELSMLVSSRLSKWILEQCDVDWPLEVGHELGAYEVLLRRVCVVRLDTRYSWKLIVEKFDENIL